jgi:hypothetical protein
MRMTYKQYRFWDFYFSEGINLKNHNNINYLRDSQIIILQYIKITSVRVRLIIGKMCCEHIPCILTNISWYGQEIGIMVDKKSVLSRNRGRSHKYTNNMPAGRCPQARRSTTHAPWPMPAGRCSPSPKGSSIGSSNTFLKQKQRDKQRTNIITGA